MMFQSVNSALIFILHNGICMQTFRESLNRNVPFDCFQVYMDIGVDVSECYEDRERLNVRHSHMECSKHGILSVVASFTPFSGNIPILSFAIIFSSSLFEQILVSL